MIRNFLITTFRILKKNTLFTFINILGFSIGLAASIIIYLWVYDELSYDKFHENADNIYRVERKMWVDGEQMEIPITSPPTAPQIYNDYPGVISFTRLAVDNVLIKDKDNDEYSQKIHYTDSTFFNFFSFELIKGNKQNMLKEPLTVAMSRSAANKYFGGDAEPGNTINMIIGGKEYPFRLTGIFEEFTDNYNISKIKILATTGLI